MVTDGKVPLASLLLVESLPLPPADEIHLQAI